MPPAAAGSSAVEQADRLGVGAGCMPASTALPWLIKTHRNSA
jgi:hypothetical protein